MKATPTHFIVVDDDPINNMLCKFSIKKYCSGAVIQTFESPEEALGMIGSTYSGTSAGLPVVLFLDINMPSMSGWDFLKHFGEFSPSVHSQFQIYILSSSVDRRDKERAENCEYVSGFLSKPLVAETLRRIFLDEEADRDSNL
ncbi:MAG TPA: response regulator [Flavobacterium sp.]